MQFIGSAGQSFGAWLHSNLTLELSGEANDYVGKGLSGGTLIIYPPYKSKFRSEKNIIIGNVAFYGATKGCAYICGQAAERFCVRNSGAEIVIEGIGNFGCEYMTGGKIINLGEIGQNLGAGMSGGIIYLYKRSLDITNELLQHAIGKTPAGDPQLNVTTASDFERDEIEYLRTKIENHYQYTNSKLANKIINNWQQECSQFIRLMTPEYSRIVAQKSKTMTSK